MLSEREVLEGVERGDVLRCCVEGMAYVSSLVGVLSGV